MIPHEIKKMAKVIVDYSLYLEEGENVLITGSPLAKPLIKEVYRQTLRKGAYPETKIVLNDLKEIYLKEASDDQLEYISPTSEFSMKEVDAYLSIRSSNNVKGLSGVDEEKMGKRQKAKKSIRKIFRERRAKEDLKWCGTLFPTQSFAQEANMSLSEYEEFVFGACHLDKEDPVKVWKQIRDRQQKIVDYLDEKDEFRYVSEDTDLVFNAEDRNWINSDGKNNFPSGEVFVSPHKESVNGKIRFNFPGIYKGKEVKDIRLKFRDGKVVDYSAEKGERLLEVLLDTDEGSRYLGECAIATNDGIQDFTKNILFDEKIGGTVHVAIGNSFPESGGENVSSVHWDMICDMKDGGKIYADDELVYKNGDFLFLEE